MKVAICDDDRIFIDIFKEELQTISYIQSIDCYFNGRDDIEDLIQGDYDIIFMDMDFSEIHKERPDGIDVAALLFGEKCPAKIVYVTSYVDRFVSQSFFKKTNAAGFLTKPVQHELLLQTLDHIREKMKDNEGQKVIFKTEGKNWTLAESEIIYIESKLHLIDLHTDERIYHVKESIASMEKKLSSSFARCHKGYLVNMGRILAYNSSLLVMDNQEEISIGRHYAKHFKEAYITFIANEI